MSLYRRTMRDLCEEAEERAARERDVAMCAHCREEMDEAAIVETSAGLDCCSTLCAVAITTYNHDERCTRGECSDAAECFTLPRQICAHCPRATDGETAHEECRARLRNALAFQSRYGGAA